MGVYTNKEDAIRNAKMSFKKMDMYYGMYNEDDDTFDRNAKKMKRHGGVLCKFEGEEGEAISVEIRRADFKLYLPRPRLRLIVQIEKFAI